MIKIRKSAILLMLISMLTFAGCSLEQIAINNSGKDLGQENIQEKSSVISNENIKIHFIDVGQADSILIQQGAYSMLIDAGNNDDGELICDYIKKQHIKKLDYVIGTHPHEDHIGGLDNVINSFDIGDIYMPKKTATTKTYKDVLTSIKAKKLSINTPNVGESFKLGEANLTIMAPFKIYEDANNCSIVLKLKYKNNSFLFAGDAEKESERDMLQAKLDLRCDVLKIGHHGSKTSSLQEFIKAVSPKYAVVSVGKNNDYGLPKVETMNKFKKFKIPLYRTDESGTIVLTSDGTNLKFDKNQGSYGGMVIK